MHVNTVGPLIVGAVVSAFVIGRPPPWVRIALRVAGSWIVASDCCCSDGRPDVDDRGKAKVEGGSRVALRLVSTCQF
jgi:hypothetical protein